MRCDGASLQLLRRPTPAWYPRRTREPRRGASTGDSWRLRRPLPRASRAPGPTSGCSRELAEIVAGHQRALLATSPFDVASSDRHTVKPWFDAKLAVSPQIIDLADAGFPLVGGRVDEVDGHPVPTIVYKRHAHVISLTAVPKPGSKDDGAPPTHATRDGYSVFAWPGRDFNYSAVSDVAPSELEEFVSRFRDVSKST
jgi:anti-sigma factor RsiW